MLLLFRKAGFILKRRGRENDQMKPTPGAPADSGTYAAQADPLLGALRHVLRLTVLRPVMSDVRTDSKLDKWALHPAGGLSVAILSHRQSASVW